MTPTAVPSQLSAQPLGRKGRETRRRLMDAAVRMLVGASPMDLTAMAIAAEAGTASATFYVYFRDVQDILFALSEVATEDMLAAFAALDIFRSNDRIAQDSEIFLTMLAEQWERHGAVLQYRMLEADRGNPRFTRLRDRWAVAVLDRFWALLKRAAPSDQPLDEIDAYAESIVLFASIERLAAAMKRQPLHRISPQRMRAAQARVLTRMMAPV